MFNRRLSSWIRGALLPAVLACATAYALPQDQKLPDAPAPQNNAPVPNVNVPPPGAPDDQGSSSSENPEQPSNTPGAGQSSTPGQNNPQPPPPGSQEIKTVPPGSVSSGGGSGRDELMTLQKTVSFVTVPVTVKDDSGKLVDGLLAKDFNVYEDGTLQKLTLFTSDPFPLSAALVIDQGLPDPVLRKINQTFAGSGRRVRPIRRSGRLHLWQLRKQASGLSATPLAWNWPCNASVMTAEPMRAHRWSAAHSVRVLRPTASLCRAQCRCRLRRGISRAERCHPDGGAGTRASPAANRKIIFVISDGQEYGSRASYTQVLKVLLTDGIAVYAIGVDTAAMPVYNKVAKARIPGFGYSNILPRYTNATGGDVLDEFSKESIESAYQRITMEARNQYTLGYNTAQKPSSNYRDIEVRVKRPGLEVFAKHGYYPLPPQRDQEPPSGEQPPPGATSPPPPPSM